MDNDDDKRQKLLLDMMTSKRSSSRPDGHDHLLHPWLRLATHLSPLIGGSGFCALYGRAARLVIPQFGWLTVSQSSNSMDALFVTLAENFAAVDADRADAANAALLTTFIELLSALIGEGLTIRLLDSAHNGELEQKHAQEHK